MLESEVRLLPHAKAKKGKSRSTPLQVLPLPKKGKHQGAAQKRKRPSATSPSSSSDRATQRTATGVLGAVALLIVLLTTPLEVRTTPSAAASSATADDGPKPWWVLVQARRLLLSTGPFVASVGHSTNCQWSPRVHEAFYTHVRNFVVGRAPAASRPTTLELIHSGAPLGVLWLTLLCATILHPQSHFSTPEDRTVLFDLVKAAAQVLTRLAEPQTLTDGALDDASSMSTGPRRTAVLLYVRLIPVVFDAAAHAMRRSWTRGVDRGSRRIPPHNACASDLGLDVSAYLYGVWERQLKSAFGATDGGGDSSGAAPSAVMSYALLCDTVLAQLTFGVCHLFQQLLAYDPDGTDYKGVWW